MTNLYFIKNEDAIKIGYSSDVDKRLSELQIANFNGLNVIYVIEDIEPSFEKHVHGICQRYKIQGEWFDIKAIDHLLNHPWFREHMIKKNPTV